MKRTALTLALAALGSITASAATFAQFTETTPTQTLFTVTNNGGGTSVSVAVTNGAIDYKFSVPTALGLNFRSGLLTFTGNSTTNATGPDGGGNLNETGFAGTGQIFDIVLSQVVLSWTYGPSGSIQVASGGTGGTFTDSRPPATEVVFSSPFLDFSISTSESFSFGLSGATSPWAIGAGSKLANNAASVVGTFDAVPLPGVPEPTSMVLLGTALVGVGLMGRKKLAR